MPKGKQILAMPKEKHIYGTAKVGEKGQLVIPKEARDAFGIKPGDNLLILGDDSTGIVITKLDALSEFAEDFLTRLKRSDKQ